MPGVPGIIDLRPRDVWALHPLFARDRVANCFAESRLGAPAGPGWPQVWGFGTDRAAPQCALMVGANLVPIQTDEEARAAFATRLAFTGRRAASIFGPAEEVLDLWSRLAPYWGPAREVRADQPLLSVDRLPDVTADPGVGPVAPHQLDRILPASIAMFTEEVGFSPVLGAAGPQYRQRVADLIAAGHCLARWDGRDVVFKADFGAVTQHAVQVQGVWIPPHLRGRGLAEPAMAAVIAYGLQLAPVVSLYVNHYNAAALRTYRSVGLKQVGTFATVLL